MSTNNGGVIVIRENSGTFRKTCSSATCSVTNPIWFGLTLNQVSLSLYHNTTIKLISIKLMLGLYNINYRHIPVWLKSDQKKGEFTHAMQCR
jgi:hypothetical protein